MFGLFDKKDEESQKRLQLARASGAFESKASIFDYLLFTEGMSMDEAEKLATKIAAIRGVPDVIEKPKKGADLYIEKAEMILAFGDKYPWARDLIIGIGGAALGGAAGFFAGKEESDKEHHYDNRPNLYQNHNINSNGGGETI